MTCPHGLALNQPCPQCDPISQGEMHTQMIAVMPYEYWVTLLKALAEVEREGYGTVTVSVERHAVKRVIPAPSLNLEEQCREYNCLSNSDRRDAILCCKKTGAKADAR